MISPPLTSHEVERFTQLIDAVAASMSEDMARSLTSQTTHDATVQNATAVAYRMSELKALQAQIHSLFHETKEGLTSHDD